MVGVADDVWISLVVPVAVLVATLLMQRLEAKLLSTPEPAAGCDHPGDSFPLFTVGPLEPSPARREPARPVLRATA